MRGPRRHRAGREPTDVGVVTAAGGEEQKLAGLVVHRRYDGDVGQVRSAEVWIVGREHVARLDRELGSDERGDGLGHRPEVNRDVGRVGHQTARGVKDRAREVSPLADVGRDCGAAERFTHLLGDRSEQVAEDLDAHGVGFGRPVSELGRSAAIAQDQTAAAVDLQTPAGFEYHRPGRLEDQSRSVDLRSDTERAPAEDRHLFGRLSGPHRGPPELDRSADLASRRRPGGSLERRAAAGAQRGDLDRSAVAAVAEALLVGGGEGLAEVRRHRDRQRVSRSRGSGARPRARARRRRRIPGRPARRGPRPRARRTSQRAWRRRAAHPRRRSRRSR